MPKRIANNDLEWLTNVESERKTRSWRTPTISVQTLAVSKHDGIFGEK